MTTYAEIIAALRRGKCDSTADALDRAVEDEARALAALPGGKWKLRDGGKAAREAAHEFYTADIGNQLTNPEPLTPARMLSYRRFPVVWAVAEVLRTNGLAPISTLRTPTQFEDAATAAAGRGDYARAAELWDAAAGATLGHKRADRYHEAAESARRLAGEQRRAEEASAALMTGSAGAAGVAGPRLAELITTAEAFPKNPRLGDVETLARVLAQYEATGDHNHGSGAIPPGRACPGGDCWVSKVRELIAFARGAS